MNLKNLIVDEFTTPSPVFVNLNTTLPEIFALMHKEKIRHILVQNDEKVVVGILSLRDITTFSQSSNFNEIEAQDIMSTNLLIVTPETKLYEVALAMSEKKYGSTIIQNEENSYTGIFTTTDALNALVEILRGDLQ